MAVLSTLANVATPGLPVGSIQAFAGANPPTGWLLCDGSAVGRGDYADLFNTIGTTYGSGNGATTFNLPDLRGRMPIGPNSDSTAANTATRSVGTKGGDTRLQSHTHPTDTKPIDARSQYSGTSDNNALFGAGDASVAITFWGFTGTYRQTTNRPSGDGSGGNMPPFLVTNYIIKAVADIARGGWYTQSSPPVVTQLPTNPAIGEECYLYVTSPYAGYQHQRYDGSAWHILADSRSKVWQSFTPGIANITIGNGTITGRYSVDGKVVNYIGQLNWGSTTSASGYFVVNLPTNAFGSLITGSVIMIDGGIRAWTGSCAPWSAGQFYIVHTESGNFGGVNQSNPFTWGSGDYFTWNLTYEIA